MSLSIPTVALYSNGGDKVSMPYGQSRLLGTSRDNLNYRGQPTASLKSCGSAEHKWRVVHRNKTILGIYMYLKQDLSTHDILEYPLG